MSSETARTIRLQLGIGDEITRAEWTSICPTRPQTIAFAQARLMRPSDSSRRRNIIDID